MFIRRIIVSKLMRVLSKNSNFTKIYTYPDEAGIKFWTHGSWESWNIRILEKYFLKDFKNKIFLDIGANLGAYTCNLSKNVKEIYAFEPATIPKLILHANTKSNKLNNVKIIEKALGEENSVMNLNYSTYSSGLASLNPYHNKNNTEFEKVDVIKLDDFVIQQNITEEIGLVKIDVEGFELSVLKGSINTLKEKKPLLQIEIDKGNSSEIIHLLKEIGYKKFYARPLNFKEKIMRRLLVENIKIIEIDNFENKFFQALWCK